MDERSRLVPLSSLTLDPVNARRHPERNMEAIKGSLARFGQQKPIVVTPGGVVVAGNGTLIAARALGWADIVVVETPLTGADLTAFALADNRTSELAEWDPDVIGPTLKSLQDMDFDIGSIGFDQDFLTAHTPEVVEGGLTDPDSVPENVDTRCKPGDLWVLGNHRLLCGDSTNVQHVERLMGGEKADLCVTDPPYNINYIGKTKDALKIANDNMSADDFRDFCRGFVGCIAASVTGCIYVFGPPGPDGRIMFTVLDEAFHHSATIVWNKDRFVLGRAKYHSKYEPCWFGWNGDGTNFVDDRTLTNVWDFPRPSASELHPTMKPVELIENAIGHASKRGQGVLDLFLGSGTTLIACEKTGRRCFGMELDPKYCDVILARWEAFTGKQATLHPGDGAGNG